jgi:hypothetical protein
MTLIARPKPQSRPRMPKPPMDITVRGLFTHTNVVKWRRRPSRKDILFIVEARHREETGWTVVGVVAENKFNHMDQTPGVPTAYRVRSQRGEEISAPSCEATVYDEPDAAERGRHLLALAVSGLRRHNAHRVLPLSAPIAS